MAAANTPKTAVPPPDMSRGATADLCDVHYPDPVDVVVEPKVQIMQPLFRCSTSIIPNLFHCTDTASVALYDAVNGHEGYTWLCIQGLWRSPEILRTGCNGEVL